MFFRPTNRGLRPGTLKKPFLPRVTSVGSFSLPFSSESTAVIHEQKGEEAGSKNSPRRFLPMTRRTLCRKLLEDENLFSRTEHVKLQDLTIGMDAAISRGFHGTLGEMKVCRFVIVY